MELNTRREIPYLRAPIYNSLYFKYHLMRYFSFIQYRLAGTREEAR